MYEVILENEKVKNLLFFKVSREMDKGRLSNIVHVRDDMNGDKI